MTLPHPAKTIPCLYGSLKQWMYIFGMIACLAKNSNLSANGNNDLNDIEASFCNK